MPHFLAARPRAVAERGRLIASLVGVLALLLGLFAMAASAGAATSKPRANAAGHHADKHPGDKAKDDNKAKDNDKAKDNNDAGDENQPPACDSSGEGNPCQPPQACGQNSGPGNGDGQCPPVNDQNCPAGNEGQGNAEDHHGDDAKGHDGKGHDDKAHSAKAKGQKGHKDDADHNGQGDACQPPPPDCNATHTCPPVNPCPVDNQGQGNVEDDHGHDAKGHDAKAHDGKAHDGKAHDAKAKGHGHKAKKDQGEHHKGRKDHNAKHDKGKQHDAEDKNDDQAQNCPPPPPVCKDGEVKKDGMCVPVEQCQAPNVVKDGECVPPKEACKPDEVMKDGNCVPVEECKPPNTVVDGVCQPPNNPECLPPNTVVDGVCQPPVNNEGCQAGQVLQNGVCVTPAPNNNVAGTPVTPTPTPTPTPVANAAPAANQPAAGVAGTQAASASARLRTQARCGTRAFRVTISGRNIRRITLSVAGRRIRTITMPAGRRSITVSVPVRRFGARRQSVQARVTFRNGARARTLTASATRCAQAAVSPQFTG